MSSADVTTLQVADGLRYWLRGYRSMLRWHVASMRLWAATTIAVELLAGCGMVLGIGLLVPHISDRAALYGTTGSAVVTLLLVGLIIGPQFIAQQKTDRTYEYLLGLPVQRSAAAIAWYTVVLAISLPGAAAAIVVGVLRYDLSLSISPQIVPAVLLTVFTATMIGYALAHAIEQPMVTVILTQLFIFLAFGYAPINFPADQMPDWLVQVNRLLPFLPMAEVIRAGLTDGLATRVAESYAVLTAWACIAGALATYVLGRRG